MKYAPINENIIVEILSPEKKEGILIIPKQEKYQRVKVLAIPDGYKDFLNIGDILCLPNHAGYMLDEEKKIVSIKFKDIICFEKEEL